MLVTISVESTSIFNTMENELFIYSDPAEFLMPFAFRCVEVDD